MRLAQGHLPGGGCCWGPAQSGPQETAGCLCLLPAHGVAICFDGRRIFAYAATKALCSDFCEHRKRAAEILTTDCDTIEMSATVPKSVVMGENMEGSDILSPLCLF